LAALAVAFAGCDTTKQSPGPRPGNPSTNDDLQSIPLQIGDAIEVQLTGTPLPVDALHMVISEQGTINLAYINHSIQAAGKTCQELQEVIRTNLVPKIYSYANVTVTPNGRYFYVGGQISGNSGRQLYLSHITVSGAINSAGGFTEFAARRRVQVTRLNGKIYIVDLIKALKHPELDLEVLPGDRINVPRRTIWESIDP
jgi:protein involved in polysaccharide export with SLBB domain